MKKLLYLTLALGMVLGFSSCKLDYFPDDELSGEVLLSGPAGAQYVVDGCYAMLKDEYEYIEYASGNTYVRHYFQMSEFPADNTCLSGRTTDPLYQAASLTMTDNLKNVGLFWWIGYRVAYSANTVIEKFAEGQNDESDQLIGEAYFLRALVHLNMVTIFAKPYILGRDNMGIPLRISTNTTETSRATVGEVYDQIVKDLRKAADLMTSRKNATWAAGYGSKNAALGLLSRVYLYMEENQKVLDVISEMGDPESYLDSDLPKYFINARTSKETLFLSAHTANETRNKSSIGSMYNADGDGWGEVYASDPLLNLYERYPDDKRLSFIVPDYAASGKDVVYFPAVNSVSEEGFGYRSNLTGEIKTDSEGKYCIIDEPDPSDPEGKKTISVTCRISDVKVNGMNEEDPSGEYTLHFVEYKGVKYPARFTKAMMQRNTFPMFFVTKFSYQDGDPRHSSPVFLRWAEIVLNRAEAEAKLGKNAEALADVNIIRKRAGIPDEGMFSAGNMHGYTDVLDVVLDERRMELAFEGHRLFDIIRNRRSINRQFGGVQPWEIVKYDDQRLQFPIPYGETSVSHIPQNPGY